MPEDLPFGDVDDARLEAAFAALLQLSRPPDSAPSTDAGVEPASDLDVSPWAPAPERSATDLTLEEAGFGGPPESELGSLQGLSCAPFTLAEPFAPPLPPLVGGERSNRTRQLVPALAVAGIVFVALAAVVTAMTRDDGSGNVRLSTPSSVAQTTIVLGTVPPPPPLPVSSSPSTDGGTAAAGSAAKKPTVPPRRSAGGSPAVKPALSSDPAPASSGGPASNSGSTSAISTPISVQQTTSETSTTAPTTSTTATPPTDPCARITDPDQLQACRNAVGG